jgi:hypothetical protein
VKNNSKVNLKDQKNTRFDPFRVISDAEFCTNLNAIIAYYQMSKGETSKRFTSVSKGSGLF